MIFRRYQYQHTLAILYVHACICASVIRIARNSRSKCAQRIMYIGWKLLWKYEWICMACHRLSCSLSPLFLAIQRDIFCPRDERVHRLSARASSNQLNTRFSFAFEFYFDSKRVWSKRGPGVQSSRNDDRDSYSRLVSIGLLQSVFLVYSVSVATLILCFMRVIAKLSCNLFSSFLSLSLSLSLFQGNIYNLSVFNLGCIRN